MTTTFGRMVPMERLAVINTTRTSSVGDPAPGWWSGRVGGFTLLELVVVMLILALAAALILPNVSRGLRSTALHRAVRETAAIMTRLRQDALREGVVKELTVASDAGQDELVWEGGRLKLQERARITDIEGGWQDADGSVHVLFYPSGGGTGVRLLFEGSAGDGPGFVVALDPLLGTVRIEQAEAQ